MMDIVKMFDDPRPIVSVEMQGTSDGDGDYYIAKFCLMIKCYGENGQGALVPWFAVIEDGEITVRLNGAAVKSVTY